MKELFKSVEKYKDSTKENEVFGKYTGADAYTQMNAALTTWAEKSGLEHKWPEAAEAPAEMMEAMGMEMEMAAEGMEGGEEMMMAAEGMEAMAAKMSLIAPDAFGEIAGPAELPKLLLSLMFVHPFFGDAVKHQVAHWELGGDSLKDLDAVATLTAAYADAGEKADADSFGASWVTEDDLEELKAVAADNANQALVFPGVVGAWASQEDALGQATEVSGRTQVLFKFKGKVMKPAGDKLHVFARQFAKLDSFTAPEGDVKYWTATLSDFTEHAFATVAEYTAAAEKAVAAAAAAKDAVAPAMEDKMMEGEGDMAPMEMAEGMGME
jgi:hypothetical protein